MRIVQTLAIAAVAALCIGLGACAKKQEPAPAGGSYTPPPSYGYSK